jgi:alpha-tubulin suppressor-like RCC1 family protein
MRVGAIGLCLAACTTPFDAALLCDGTADGAPCGGGTCRAGACCRSCWDGSICHEGDVDSVCGIGGGVCVECRPPADRCSANVCAPRRPAIDIAASGRTSCAVDEAGGLWCWGANEFGALGIGDPSVGDSAIPRRVGGGDDWIGVDTGNGHGVGSCAIHRLGTLHCWGLGGNGQLGVGDSEGRDVPTEVPEPGPWTTVTCGGYAMCGLVRGGAIYCWGGNGSNSIGFESPDPTRPQPFPTARRFHSISMHDRHTCAISIEDELYCWGENSSGQLGHDGAEIAAVAPGSTWTSIATGSVHTCGVRTDGTLWCWGGNPAGEVGREAAMASLDLTRVDDATDWADVTAGGGGPDGGLHLGFTCARKIDGRLFCFGANDDSQLGDGTTVSRHTLVEVLGDLRFRAMDAGFYHVCAIAENGVVHCWGDGGNRQNGASAGYVDLPQPTAIAIPSDGS